MKGSPKERSSGTREPIRRLTVTIDEAAAALGIGRNSAYAAARTGQIPTIRVGKRLLVVRAELEKMLGAHPAREEL